MKKSVLILGLLAQVTIAEAFSLSNEKCWTTKPILQEATDAKNLKEEQKLCSLDFHDGTYSICPKLNSTYPGVLVMKRKNDMSDAEFRSKICLKVDDLKQIEDEGGAEAPFSTQAKFKQTASCSHSSSPVAYYRVAEFLGAGRVPVAVFRTMDKQKHLEITNQAVQHFGMQDMQLIAQNWRLFLARHNNPAANPDIFKGNTVYGSLSENIKNEYQFTQVSGFGSYETRYERFIQQPAFLAVASEKSVAALAQGTSFDKLAQVVTTMRDVSTMVVLDYMLSQADRIGNIHYKYKLYKQVGDQVEEEKSETRMVEQPTIINGKKTLKKVIVTPPAELARIKSGEVVRVQELILKDNDCGISKENMMKKVGALEKMRHMNAKVYRQVQKLAQFVQSKEGETYFENEIRIPNDLFDGTAKQVGVKSNIVTAARILKANCESGLLKLDLTLEKLLKDPNYKDSCNVE